MAKIIGERLKKLLREKKISQEKFAEMVGVKREVISQICNDSYKHTLKQYTLKRIYNALNILKCGDNIPLYLSGEVEYNDINTFSSDSTPARAYRATEMISDILAEIGYSVMLDDRRHIRVYGKKIRNKPEYVDMDASEYMRFKFFVLEQMKAACNNYVSACYVHDETLELKTVHNPVDPVGDLHYYPDK